MDHWDLFRLQGEDELESAGFCDQFSLPVHKITPLVLVEWPEKVSQEWWPNDWKIISMNFTVQPHSRRIEISEL